MPSGIKPSQNIFPNANDWGWPILLNIVKMGNEKAGKALSI
jgi:hypothetical protein